MVSSEEKENRNDVENSQIELTSEDSCKQDSILKEENARLRAQVKALQERLRTVKDGDKRQDSSPPSWRRWISSGDSSPRGQHQLVPQDDVEITDVERGLHHRHGHGISPTVHEEEEHKPVTNPLKEKQSDIGDGESQSSLVTFGSNESDDDEAAEESFWKLLVDRAGWLVGLLILQSCSSFIIRNNEHLLQAHLVIVQFLTMLVGAGGNAGNQASVRVIRGLAVGTVRNDNVKGFLWSELRLGVCLSLILAVVGCIRAAIFLTPLAETCAITVSLLVIVVVSIVLGATLPLAMNFVSIDPAHSSTTIQVLMDILGVTITVYTSGAILDSRLGDWLTSS